MSNISRLPNPAIGTLADRIIGITETTKQREFSECAVFQHLVAKSIEFTRGFDHVEKSTLTSSIKKLDKNRCMLLKSLSNQIKSDLCSPLADVQEAAKRIDNVLKSEGTLSEIVGESMSNRTKIIAKVLNNLNSDPLRADIAILNIAIKVDALATIDGEFEAMYARRSNEKAEASSIISATSRRGELENAIRDFTAYVKAMITVNADPKWQDLYNKIEARVDEVSRSYRPKSRTKKDSDK